MNDETKINLNGKPYIWCPGICVVADVGFARDVILTVDLSFEGDGWGVGCTGMCLSQYDKTFDRQVGTSWGCEFIMQVLSAFGVEKFRDVKKRPVDILFNGNSMWVGTVAGFRCRKFNGGSGEWMVFQDVRDPVTGRTPDESRGACRK